MRFIAGPLNKQLLQNLLGEVIESCTRVRAAVAYASRDNMKLFEARAPATAGVLGRYDHTVAVDPAVLKGFWTRPVRISTASSFPTSCTPRSSGGWMPAPTSGLPICLIGPGYRTSKRAPSPHDELVETGMERELQRFFEEVDDRARCCR